MIGSERTSLASRGPVRGSRRRGEGRSRPGAGPSWRDEVKGASGVNLMAGIWLVLSPWALDLGSTAAVWNAVITGSFVATVSLLRLASVQRASWLSRLNVLAGTWLMVSAFVLPDTVSGFWGALLLGFMVALLGAWSAAASDQRRTRR